ncbi:glycosyltransferase [Flavobacterium qiangtangense]|uniref:Glycosyltransferase n=1 Tax=Flavobacterium qiangtangense TaxID=1442595 RepID=A0ABW1PRL3_9FLAO
MISVVIRAKNQAPALEFLLKNLKARYSEDIDEIIVIDNLSNDNSENIVAEHHASFVTIRDFSYGGSANLAAQSAKNPIVVLFSAHSYPVSHDFFKVIKKQFEGREDLAGVRCLHQPNDYRNYIQNISAEIDPNKSGLIFSGSAFYRPIWKKIPFDDSVATFEDKDWTVRVLKAGYKIEFAPAIFSYEIKRTRKQIFQRYKNDIIGNFQLWGQKVTFKNAIHQFLGSSFNLVKSFFIDFYYIVLRFVFLVKFVFQKKNN